MESTIIEIIISEAQNEVRDFQKWSFDILPHRVVMKQGFQTPDGKRVAVEDAFKDPQHPFRIAIVCANRVYPGKDCGVIVDYNGMLKSLREALA
jgi:type I restriction enzyme R subunit